MSIGQRKQVQLVKISVTTATDGEQTEEDGDRFGVWAEVKRPSGFRGYQNGQVQLANERVFKIRFRFDKHPGAEWKIRYDARDWTISNVQKLEEKNFYWQIIATAKSDV